MPLAEAIIIIITKKATHVRNISMLAKKKKLSNLNVNVYSC